MEHGTPRMVRFASDFTLRRRVRAEKLRAQRTISLSICSLHASYAVRTGNCSMRVTCTRSTVVNRSICG